MHLKFPWKTPEKGKKQHLLLEPHEDGNYVMSTWSKEEGKFAHKAWLSFLVTIYSTLKTI